MFLVVDNWDRQTSRAILPDYCRKVLAEFPPNKTFPTVVDGYEVAYYLPKSFRKLGWEFEGIRWRQGVFTIYFDGALVGFFHVRDIQIFNVDDLFLPMDEVSADLGQLATALEYHWDGVDHEVGGYGTVLLVEDVWMHPAHAKDGLWRKFASAIEASLFKSYAIIATRPFGVEWSEDCPGLALPLPESRRGKAMLRYFKRHFELRPMKAPKGSEGWYWQPAPRLKEIFEPDEPERKYSFSPPHIVDIAFQDHFTGGRWRLMKEADQDSAANDP